MRSPYIILCISLGRIAALTVPDAERVKFVASLWDSDENGMFDHMQIHYASHVRVDEKTDKASGT